MSKKGRNKRRLADMDMYSHSSEVKKNPHKGNIVMKKWKKKSR